MGVQDIVGSLGRAALSALGRPAAALGRAALGAARAATGGPDRSAAPSPRHQRDTAGHHEAPGQHDGGEVLEPHELGQYGHPYETDEHVEDDMTDQADLNQHPGQDTGVELPPMPDLEPPVPIVEQVLEAEQTEPHYEGGRVTEPKASTRDEEHGDAHLQRAEIEELAQEVAESFPEGQLDVATPVGTTGADVGYNPDTAEADLQQPGTPPIMDPGTVHAVLSESETLRAASDPDKG